MTMAEELTIRVNIDVSQAKEDLRRTDETAKRLRDDDRRKREREVREGGRGFGPGGARRAAGRFAEGLLGADDPSQFELALEARIARVPYGIGRRLERFVRIERLAEGGTASITADVVEAVIEKWFPGWFARRLSNARSGFDVIGDAIGNVIVNLTGISLTELRNMRDQFRAGEKTLGDVRDYARQASIIGLDVSPEFMKQYVTGHYKKNLFWQKLGRAGRVHHAEAIGETLKKLIKTTSQ